MASEDFDYEHFVQVMAKSLYATIVLMMVAAGVHVFMALYGLSVFLETPKPQREGRGMYIFISLLITTLAVVGASLDSYHIFKVLMEATSTMSFMEMSKKYVKSWERVTSVFCSIIIIFIGDTLLVYRCYAIWRHRWYVAALPALTYIASVGMGLGAYIPPYIGVRDTTPNSHEAAWIFLNVSTTVMVTGLISFHLLSARARLSKVLPRKDLKLYTGVVAMLIESALPLSVVGLVIATLLVVGRKLAADYYIVYFTFSFCYYALTALSPHLIIFRITTNRSWTHSPPLQASTDGAISRPIEFERPPQSFTDSSIMDVGAQEEKKEALQSGV